MTRILVTSTANMSILMMIKCLSSCRYAISKQQSDELAALYFKLANTRFQITMREVVKILRRAELFGMELRDAAWSLLGCRASGDPATPGSSANDLLAVMRSVWSALQVPLLDSHKLQQLPNKAIK